MSGEAPAGRSYHSATAIDGGRSMVLFGGNDDKQCFSEVHVLSVTQPKSPPPSRASAPIISDSTSGGGGVMEDEEAAGAAVGGEWEWSQPMVMGKGPAPRTGHGACLLSDGKTILVHENHNPSLFGNQGF